MSVEMQMERLIDVTGVPRIEDLPYWDSPPIQFVYESETALALGSYTWADAASALTPDRPLIDNALYYFRHISLAADVSELDFTANIVTTPLFYTFRQSDAKTVLFREPIQMNKFYNDFDYRFAWKSQKGSDQLFAAFRGVLVQGAAFIGKASITLKAVISAQEIVGEHFIDKFTKGYPKGGRE